MRSTALKALSSPPVFTAASPGARFTCSTAAAAGTLASRLR
jgi:hypothetical protein